MHRLADAVKAQGRRYQLHGARDYTQPGRLKLCVWVVPDCPGRLQIHASSPDELS